jgi:hypothetical protein
MHARTSPSFLAPPLFGLIVGIPSRPNRPEILPCAHFPMWNLIAPPRKEILSTADTASSFVLAAPGLNQSAG